MDTQECANVTRIACVSMDGWMALHHKTWPLGCRGSVKRCMKRLIALVHSTQAILKRRVSDTCTRALGLHPAFLV